MKDSYLRPATRTKQITSFGCCCESKRSLLKLTDEDLLIINKASSLRFSNYSPNHILHIIKKYSFNGRLSLNALEEADLELGGASLSSDQHQLRWLFYSNFVLTNPHTGGSTETIQKPNLSIPPADWSEDESTSNADQMLNPKTQIDALKLATCLIYLSRASETERAFSLFYSYDQHSLKQLSEHQLKYLFHNAFYLVANALPSLFIGKERGAGSITNQAKAMQARVKTESEQIVGKLLKHHLRRKKDKMSRLDSQRDLLIQQIKRINRQSSNNTSTTVSPGRRSLVKHKRGYMQNKYQEKSTGHTTPREQLKLTKEDFISFFKKSDRNGTLLTLQGLRDSVMPVIMSRGSFHMYKAAASVLASEERKRRTMYSPSKRVRFSHTNMKKKEFREEWSENTEGGNSLVLGGMRLTSSMQQQKQNNGVKGAKTQEESLEEWSISKRSFRDRNTSRTSSKSSSNLRLNLTPKIFDEDYQ